MSRLSKPPPDDRYYYQKRARQENRERILAALKGRAPLRFKELSNLGMSVETLSANLKGLQADKLVEKIIFEGRPAYALTADGHNVANDVWFLMFELLELKRKGGAYLHDGDIDGTGLSSDVVFDIPESDFSQAPLPPSPELIRMHLFDFIMRDILKQHHEIPPLSGKLIASLEIDYCKLSDFLIRLQIFIDDVNQGRDVLSDVELGLKNATDRAFKLYTYFKYASQIGDSKLDAKLKKLSKKLNRVSAKKDGTGITEQEK